MDEPHPQYSVTELRKRLPEVLHNAAVNGQITYATYWRKPAAAVVPLSRIASPATLDLEAEPDTAELLIAALTDYARTQSQQGGIASAQKAAQARALLAQIKAQAQSIP